MTEIAYRMSEQIDAISGAIAKAQAELENVDRTGTNPAFKAGGEPSKYVKLGAVLDAVRPVFAKHGIAIVQMAVNGEGSNIGVVTLLAHAGQWIESRLYVAPMKFDAQGAGSALTYCRRYALMAMAGVAPDDDDGTAAVARPETAAMNGNGKAHTSAEREAQLATATAYKDEIKAGIEAAEEPAAIDRLLKTSGPKLEFIKQYHEATYSRLMELATARGNELRSAG